MVPDPANTPVMIRLLRGAGDKVGRRAGLVTYSMQGKEDKAEPLKKQVMETRKRVLDDEHPDTLNSIVNLAFTF